MRMRTLLPLLFALCVAACTTTTVRQPVPAASRQAPAVAEAALLAGTLATLPPQERAAAAARIDRLLATLDDATLVREARDMPEGDPLYDFAGRALLNRGLPLPRPFTNAGTWQFDAGARPPAAADGYRPPVELAVLLPLTGNLSTAAVPVRDGLLAGYYAEQRRRPHLRFYDTAGGAVAAYDRAVADGADYVLGPLGRDEVGALFRRDALPVPVLALNRASTPPPPGSASFSLAPEDDGIAAAEFLLARNARRVLVLADADDGMQRAVSAFREQFQQRGGTVAAQLAVPPDADGMGDALAAAAAGGDVDAVFMAVRAPQAAALKPLLAAAGLAGKWQVATSQLASASDAVTAGHALDGIAFPSDAWEVRGVAGLPSVASAAELLPSARGAAQRLFAFGHDAWLLTAYLERLASDGNASLPGATGTLRLDGFGNVVRTPAWSTYDGSSPRPLPRAGG